VIDRLAADVVEGEPLAAVRELARVADESQAALRPQRKYEQKVRVLQVDVELVVYRHAVGFHVRDIKKARLRAAGESEAELVPHCRRRTVAARDILGLALFRSAVRAFERRAHDALVLLDLVDDADRDSEPRQPERQRQARRARADDQNGCGLSWTKGGSA